MFVIAAAAIACGQAKMTELQRAKSGTVDIVLLSPRDGLRHGSDSFVIEFRSASGELTEVGTVRASASMSMSGTPMMGTIDVARTEVAGRYAATSELSMAGTWRMTIQWDGPAGAGSVTFPGSVQ
jgi:YtkA-like protein